MRLDRLTLLFVAGFITGLTIVSEPTVLYAQEAERDPAAQARATPKPTVVRKRTVGDLLKGYQDLKKTNLSIPKAAGTTAKAVRPLPLSKVAPMRSESLFQQDDQNEAELEKILDREIDELYKLTTRYKKSQNRGELWLRLAELYVEKARLFNFRTQNKFDKDIAAWEASGQKGPPPKMDARIPKTYNQKAIQLYEWFLSDFPKDSKIDQALFFLGYNYIELDQLARGVQYYEQLTKKFPSSPYVSESHFALGEYYFDNRDWKKAFANFKRVLDIKTARLYSFALYKMGWCYYRLGKVDAAIKTLEQVIYHSRRQVEVSRSQGLKSVNRIRLATEALKDIVPFYHDIRDYKDAKDYFLTLGGEKALFPLLERLAYVYSDGGKQEQARYIFKQLLDMRPTSPKAFDYQYQIVQNYSSRGDRSIFKSELFSWINEYSPDSEWARANAKDLELQKRVYELRETTLRNYVLQNHQTAQNAKNPVAQKNALVGYEMYLQTFGKAEKFAEMRFFFGELLFDLKQFDAAFIQYDWVAENSAKNTKYYEQAVLNAVLSAEKNLPKDEDVRKRIGNNLEALPYGQPEVKFMSSAERYLQTFPKGDKVADIRFKVGRIAYSYNHFDEALKIFQDIVKKYPKTQYATYAANLILDIYNLRNDYEGLAKAGSELMQSPELMSAGAGADIKDAVERASFKGAQEAEVNKNYAESAKQYEQFAKKYPNSKLAPSAKYNAAINYERAGQIVLAIAGYKAVVENRDKKNPTTPDVRKKSQRLIARLYEQTGQYENAATEFETYARQNPKDQYEDESYYNAAILWDALGNHSRAITNYEKYFDISKKANKREALFLIAAVQEKRGSLSAAIQYYQKYLSTSPSAPEKVIASNYKIAVLSRKLNRQSEYKKGCERTIAVQRKFGKVGASEAAECKYEISLNTIREFEAIRIPSNPAKQGAALKQKLDYISRINNEMSQVIKYDDGNYIIAALTTTGRAYEHMNRTLNNAPKPSGLKPEELKQYNAEIDKIAAPLKQSAIDNYNRAVSKAFEIHFYNQWMTEAMSALNRFDRALYPDTGERTSEVREIDISGI